MLFLLMLMLFFVSPHFDLNLTYSSFASFKLISPFLILSIRTKTLSNLLKSSSVVLPLYLNNNLLVSAFLSRLFIFSKLSSVSLLYISFSFKTVGLSLMSQVNFSIDLIGILS